MSARRGYSGVLINQIVLPYRDHRRRFIAPDGPARIDRTAEFQDAEQIKSERDAKFRKLFAHFGIDPSLPQSWESLATELAIQHVPGFQTRRAKGAPTIKTVSLLCRLYRHVIGIKSRRAAVGSPRISVHAICAQLTKDKKFKSEFPALANSSAKRLQNLFTDALGMRRARVQFSIERRHQSEMWGDAPPWFFADDPFKKPSQKAP